MSPSDYETWVRALRAWGSDPATDLSGLPTLSLESFPPTAYDRFISHLTKAVAAMMEGWAASLSEAIDRAQNPQEHARALVDARKGLARRLLLCEHPGLPEEIRTALRTAAQSDIEGTQAELEKAAAASNSRASIERPAREASLKLVRDNALTAVLAPGFPLADYVAGRYELAAAPTPRPDLSTEFGPVPRRRIVLN